MFWGCPQEVADADDERPSKMPKQPSYPPSAAVYGKGAYKGVGGLAAAGMDWPSGMAQALAAGLQVL